MRRTALLAPLLLLPALAVPAAAQSAAPTVEVVPLEFTVLAGPDDRECTVLGDLYVPSTATAASPAAAIMATNGFGGGKDDAGERGNATVAQHYAERGYVGLSYSGLGFGGSGCEITLDQREWDGRVGDQLAQFLGGRTGLATRDGAPYDIGGIVRTESSGLEFDPVLGTIGVSYGGEVQFATASFGRVDTIVPQITWNDLSYSLAPSNTDQLRQGQDPRSVSAPVGVSKIGWTSLFFALGLTQDLSNQRPEDLLEQVQTANACPNFDSRSCTAILDLASDGAPSQATIDFARGASVASYLDDIDIPVLLSQGQADTLFNLQEAIATWTALRERDVPVKMVWQSWGHSTATPVPGELDQRLPAEETFEGALYAQWFDHYLLGRGPAPSLDTEYFRDWMYTGDGPRRRRGGLRQRSGVPGRADAADAAVGHRRARAGRRGRHRRRGELRLRRPGRAAVQLQRVPRRAAGRGALRRPRHVRAVHDRAAGARPRPGGRPGADRPAVPLGPDAAAAGRRGRAGAVRQAVRHRAGRRDHA